MLIDSYDSAVINVLDIYMEGCEDITLVEFGRGNGALAEKYLEQGKKVTIIEDFDQQIFQANRDYYSDYNNILVRHNVLDEEGWDDLQHTTDLIFCSLPFTVPHAGDMPDDAYQTMLNKGFLNLTTLLAKGGRLITVDYNTPQIVEAIEGVNLEITPLIAQGDDVHYMASVLQQ